MFWKVSVLCEYGVFDVSCDGRFETGIHGFSVLFSSCIGASNPGIFNLSVGNSVIVGENNFTTYGNDSFVVCQIPFALFVSNAECYNE